MPSPSNPSPSNISPTRGDEVAFSEVVQLIGAARERAIQAVNAALIDFYWEIGATISRKIEAAEWGDGTVDKLALFIARTQPGLRGFSRPNLFRMKQFYEAYREEAIVSPLVRQLPWSHHLVILGQSKRQESANSTCVLPSRKDGASVSWSASSKLLCLSAPCSVHQKVSPVVRQTHPEALSIFRDAYTVEFLALPAVHAETDLHRGLLEKLKDFLTELGRDFCFVGSEYPLQVGDRDFALDLLFFHRGFNCLVAIELKVDRFEPEFLGKLNFYLEALDPSS
jgi:predicted nuclease of restriction endonuclease-like (RecB) superfamily